MRSVGFVKVCTGGSDGEGEMILFSKREAG